MSETRRSFSPLVIGLMLAFGCLETSVTDEHDGEPATETVASPPGEVSWQEQVEAVRSGESHVIRHSERAISSDEWMELADGCESLTVLEADFRLLTADDLSLLANLPQLERLKLRGPVDDPALVQIIRAAGQLEVLNLPDGIFSDMAVESLPTMPNLELLRFGSPHVTDAAMPSIAAIRSLRFLHLLDVPISDAGLEPLHGLSQLESFYLDGGNCTDSGLRELLKALPELHFHRDQVHLPDDPQSHPHK